MEDKRDGDGLRDGHHPPPHDARSSFESAQRMRTQGELARLREEQGRLRERQDALDRALQARKPDGAAKPEAKDQDGANQDEDGEPSGEGKEKTSAEPPTKDDAAKPGVGERLRGYMREHPYRAIVIAIGIVAALVGGVLFYMHTLTYEDTDDAQIDGDISAVSTRVLGTVIAVAIVDNQRVHAGDLIATLDPGDFDQALAQARAGLAQAEAQLKAEQPNLPITRVTNKTSIATSSDDVATAQAALASTERDLAQTNAQVLQAQANDRYAQVESQRSAYLVRAGAVAQSDADQRTSAADATSAFVIATQQAALATRKMVDEQRAKLASASVLLVQARDNAPRTLEVREATLALREAAVLAARAELGQAELNRSYTRILAPVDGIVGSKSVNVGDHVQPGQQLAGITQMVHLWVTADFRESQLQKMHPGQPVKIHVDALDREFRGQVESLPGATGSRFSLLPPENATGNYVKVVQRLSVRISLDPGQDDYDRLRPGMSVEPTVSLR
jgi:membrane fusion protein (multidrug efflux system)